jgi:Tfp pilus assembly protein PilO
LKQDLNGLEKDLAMLKKGEFKQKEPAGIKRIILEDELPLFLQKVSNLANTHKIKIMQMRPLREQDTKDVKLTAEPLKRNSIFINLDLSGDYHNLGRFINALENAPELLSVESIKIESVADNYFQQNAFIEIRVYVKK